MAILPRPNPLSWRFKGTKGPYKTFTVELPAQAEVVRESLREKAGLGSVPQLDVVLFLEAAPERALADKAVVMPKAKLLVQRLSKEDAKKVISLANVEHERKLTAAAVSVSSGSGAGSTASDVAGMTNGTRDVGAIGACARAASVVDATSAVHAIGGRATADGGDGSGGKGGAAVLGSTSGRSEVPTGSSHAGTTWSSAVSAHGSVDGGGAGAAGAGRAAPSAEFEEEQLRINSLMARQHDLFSSLSGAPSSGPESLSHRYHRNKNFNMTWNPQDGESMGRAVVGGAGSGGVNVADYERHSSYQANLPPVAGIQQRTSLEGEGSNSLSAPPSTVLMGAGWGGGKPVGSLLSSGAPGAPSFPNAGGTGQFNLHVRPDYVCHMCGEKGHHIRNCPRGHDAKFQKKVKPATGIPSNFLQDIDADDIPLYPQVYIRKDGTFAVMKKSQQISSHAYFREDLDRRIESHLGSAAHLKCPLCRRIFKSPVVTPCCGDSFCRKCLNEALTTREYGGRNKCPSCRQSINPAEIMPNKVLAESVDAVFRGSASGPAVATVSSQVVLTATIGKGNVGGVVGGYSVSGGAATGGVGVSAPGEFSSVVGMPGQAQCAATVVQQHNSGVHQLTSQLPRTASKSGGGSRSSSAACLGGTISSISDSNESTPRHVLAATSRSSNWPPTDNWSVNGSSLASGHFNGVLQQQFGSQLSGRESNSPENHPQRSLASSTTRKSSSNVSALSHQDAAGAYIDQFLGGGSRKRKAAMGEDGGGRTRYAKTANVSSFLA